MFPAAGTSSNGKTHIRILIPERVSCSTLPVASRQACPDRQELRPGVALRPGLFFQVDRRQRPRSTLTYHLSALCPKEESVQRTRDVCVDGVGTLSAPTSAEARLSLARRRRRKLLACGPVPPVSPTEPLLCRLTESFSSLCLCEARLVINGCVSRSGTGGIRPLGGKRVGPHAGNLQREARLVTGACVAPSAGETGA